MAGERHFRSVQAEVADDFRQLGEAWRRARKQDPHNYADTPVADKFREEHHRIEALFENREFRPCEHCGEKAKMRKAQVYCSTRCRVAAHRTRQKLSALP